MLDGSGITVGEIGAARCDFHRDRIRIGRVRRHKSGWLAIGHDRLSLAEIDRTAVGLKVKKNRLLVACRLEINHREITECVVIHGTGVRAIILGVER